MRAIPFVLVLLILVFGAVTAVQTLTAPSGDATPTPVRPTVTARPRPTSPGLFGTAQPLPALSAGPTSTPSTASAPAAPSPTAIRTVQTVMKVGNTGREGVYIRRTPNMNDKIRPWMDGTPMTVLGPPQTVNGITWIKVRAPDGVEGYIPSQYLVP